MVTRGNSSMATTPRISPTTICHVRLQQHLHSPTCLPTVYRQTGREVGRQIDSPEHRLCSVDSNTAEIFVCRDKLLYASAAESIDIVGGRPAMNPFIVVECGLLLIIILLLSQSKTQNATTPPQ